MSKKKKIEDMTDTELVQEYGYNLRLIQQIQPAGGLSFKDEKFIKTGEGYEAVLQIYEFPNTVSSHWLRDIMSIKNIVTVLDISTENKDEVIRNINRSTGEQKERRDSAQTCSEQKEAVQRLAELTQLYDEVSICGEIIKLVTIRIFIAAQTIVEADKKAKEVLNTLAGKNFKATIYLNEGKAEWKSLFQTYTEQQQTEYKRCGQPMQSESLAAGDPLHFSSLSDPNGTYFGYTSSSNGNVLLDIFCKTPMRSSYNSLVFGKMGKGKSTTLKKTLLDRAVRGDYIRGFDFTGEYTLLVEHLGGKIISFDGSQGIINDLEILKTGETDEISYAQHISKLATIYQFLSPKCDDYELAEYQMLCNELYESWGILNQKAGDHITGLSPKEYPTYSDLLSFINKKLEDLENKANQSQQTILKTQRLSNIQLIISKFIRTYGNIVDGYTSIENLLDTQIVYFNVKNLSKLNADIFDSRIYSILSLFWDGGLKIGEHMKELWENHQIVWEDITRYLIIVDEAQHIINTNKLMAVEQINSYQREGRKYFVGFLLAFQSIRDAVPKGADKESIRVIQTLFDLSQYKFIFNQDSNARDVLRDVFREELTEYQLSRIPRFVQGQCLLVISGDTNIEFNLEITPDEAELFKGGA